MASAVISRGRKREDPGIELETIDALYDKDSLSQARDAIAEKRL